MPCHPWENTASGDRDHFLRATDTEPKLAQADLPTGLRIVLNLSEVDKWIRRSGTRTAFS